MKSWLINILFIFAFSAISVAQPNNGLNFTDSKGLKQGAWKKTDELGRIKYEGSFKNGKPEGSFVYYFENGKKKAATIYSQNGKLARAILFHENGEKKAVGNYLNEKKDSTWLFYDEKGRLASSENYKENMRNGKSIVYYNDTLIFEQSEWENNIKNGLSIQYYENGKKKEEGTFKNGKYEGKVIRYHATGEKSAYGSYYNGFQAGDWFYYDEKGFPTFKETIKKGERDNFVYYNGTFDEEYPNGIPKLHISYKNKKKHGAFKEYYPKGTYKLVPKNNTDGSEDDIERVLTGTQVKVEGAYFEDNYDGVITFYQEDGKIDRKETYTKGVLINKK